MKQLNIDVLKTLQTDLSDMRLMMCYTDVHPVTTLHKSIVKIIDVLLSEAKGLP